MSEKALEGIRVLGFAIMAAGPAAGTMMTGCGTEVIKIGWPARGEGDRKFPPMADGESLPHCWFNRGKKSLAMDLMDPEGLRVVKKLLPTANVILESFRPGTMREYGLDYESVRAVERGIVYAPLITFGQTGEYVSKPGYDIVTQATSGIMSVTGEADGAPQESGSSLGDLLEELNMFTGVMTALYHWRDIGEG